MFDLTLQDLEEAMTRREFVQGAVSRALTRGPDLESTRGMNPWIRQDQIEVLDMVGMLMRREITGEYPVPIVINFGRVRKEIFLDTYGKVPTAPINHFHHQLNLIILVDDARIDQLAHEFVHFVQWTYEGMSETPDEIFNDWPEEQAVRIQQKFPSYQDRPRKMSCANCQMVNPYAL